MDDTREVPKAHPPHSAHSAHSAHYPQSTQWGEDDLKAQEDLLSLKILQDPRFLARVPTLNPTASGMVLGTPQAEWQSHASAADPAPPGPSPLNTAASPDQPVADSHFNPTPSMAPLPSALPHGLGEEKQGSLDRPRRNDLEPGEQPPLTRQQIEDTHLKMITQEVTQRVLEQLEDLLPELIASTLEEVLSGVSTGPMMGSAMGPAGEPHR